MTLELSEHTRSGDNTLEVIILQMTYKDKRLNITRK